MRGYYGPLRFQTMTMSETHASALLEPVRAAADSAGVFAAVELAGDLLRCRALGSAEEAWYRVRREEGRWFVELVTADRWLSESIEADLMHYGDPIEELVEEELVEIEEARGGSHRGQPAVQHFRSEDRLYTFRTAMSGPGEPADPAATINMLLAYEAAFRRLGDMSAAPDAD